MNVWVNITSSQSLRKWFEPSIVGSFSNFQLNFNSNQLWNLKIVKLKSVNLHFYDFHCENIQCSASDWIERLPLSFSSIDHWGKKQLVITWQRIIEKSDCCSAWGTIDRHTKEKCFYWMISTWNQNMDNNMLRNGNTGCLISNQRVKKKIEASTTWGFDWTWLIHCSYANRPAIDARRCSSWLSFIA